MFIYINVNKNHEIMEQCSYTEALIKNKESCNNVGINLSPHGKMNNCL